MTLTGWTFAHYEMIHFLKNGPIIEFFGIEIPGLYWTYMFGLGLGLCTSLGKHIYYIAYRLLTDFINLSNTCFCLPILCRFSDQPSNYDAELESLHLWL